MEPGTIDATRSRKFSLEPEKIRQDPIGLFLEQINKITPAVEQPSSHDFSYLSSEERAESLWAVFQDVKGLMSGRKLKGKTADIKKLELKIEILRNLYDDAETREVYLAGNQKHWQEIESINGNYERYQVLHTQINAGQEAFDVSARQMFLGRAGSMDEVDILLFEANQRQLNHSREELESLLKNNPELGALVQCETLFEYAKQLHEQNFIWSPSRRQALEEIELAALSGKPLLISGESGTGKTRVVEQASLVLTGLVNNATPGKDVRFQDLIAKPKIGPDGGTYYEYKEIGEAVTGKSTTREQEPSHTGRIIADDEFNLLAPAEQTERLARIATWTPGKKVRMPVTNEEIIVQNYLYCAMVNLASQRYDRKKIPPEVLRKFAKVDLDYPPQTETEPELYEMMLGALIDENKRLRASVDEVSPRYIFKEEMKTIDRGGQQVKCKVQIRELESQITTPDGARTVPAGGFLWRFSNALNELNKSVSHQETVLKSKGDAQYLKDLIIDVGTVFGWLKEYRTVGRNVSLENFIIKKLKTEFLDRAAYSTEDRKLVKDFLKHFGIDADQKIDAKASKPKFTNLTRLDIGLLSPRVQYEKVLMEEPQIAESYLITEDGERIEYFIKLYEENGVSYKPGAILQGSDKKLYEFHGVTKITGEPVLSLYKEKKSKPKGREKSEARVTMERAKEIMATDFLGSEAVEKAFHIKLETKDIPPIPFSEAELERAKDLGQFLVLRVDKTQDGKPFTMQKMNELLEAELKKVNKGKVLYSVDWYKDQEFFTTEKPKIGWALTSREIIPDSTSQNYLQQIEILVDHVKDKIFAGQNVPKEYAEAIAEFEEYYGQNFKNKTDDEIKKLLGGNGWKIYAKKLSELKINQLTRQSPAEVLYDLLIYLQNNGRLLENRHTWTNRRDSDGYIVDVGSFVADGARVNGDRPDSAREILGVVFSRSQ